MSKDRALIVSGFRDDCRTLLDRFEKANDIRFETFCEIWKDMKFSLVFTGRQAMIELMEFCEEALQICKQLFLLPTRFNERIGALYLLYGVYYKMPTRMFKIRMKLEDWKIITELHTEIKEGEHLDANYILCKLIADNAFHYCMFDKEFGLEKHYRIKEKLGYNPHTLLPEIKELAEDGQLLANINALSKIYNEKKKALFSKTKKNSSLSLYDTNVADDIINEIIKFDKERVNHHIKGAIDNRNISCPSTSNEESQNTSRLRLIRNPKNVKFSSGVDFDSEIEISDEVDSDDSDD